MGAYNLCPQCFFNAKKLSEDAKSSLKCKKDHNLYKLSLSELQDWSEYPKKYATFICDQCLCQSDASRFTYSLHCPLCRYDLCPQCIIPNDTIDLEDWMHIHDIWDEGLHAKLKLHSEVIE